MANKEADETNTEVVVKPEDINQETKTTETEGKEAGGEGDEVVVLIDGVSPNPEDVEDTAETPVWIKDLRQRYKESSKQLRAKDEEIERLKKALPSAKPTEIGPKPTLEGCEYDEGKFETELLSWQKRKDKAEAEVAEKQKEVEEVQKVYQVKQQGYEVSKSNLKVKDFPEAEDVVKATFSVVQQGIIIKGCKDASIVVYALGKNPDTSKKLAAIKDPIEFAFEVARLEGNLKVSTRKAPPPDKKPNASGGASNAGGVDKELDRLRAEAEKTGNYTKVVAYKKQLKDKTG
jgi:hypothetical protein